MASPGPTSTREGLVLYIKGICMGAADIIPGVSGGTIALIAGIYHQLLLAIKSFNMESIGHLFRMDLKSMLSQMHIRFMLTLLAGIATAIISITRLMHYLMNHHAVLTWSLFFGLIGASIFILSRNIKNWIGAEGFAFAIGAIIAYFLVGIIPVSTPETLWFIFFCGMIAICAMILPGVSGAFLLLVLGKYEFVTGALKNPFNMENLLIIAVFCAGCLIGIMGFSRILSYLLSRYELTTMALLTGLMCGAIRKIWPWKEVIESKIIRGKVHVLAEQNVLPPQLNGEFFLACGLAILGFIVVFTLEKVANQPND